MEEHEETVNMKALRHREEHEGKLNTKAQRHEGKAGVEEREGGKAEEEKRVLSINSVQGHP